MPFTVLTPSYTPRGRAETDGGSGPLAMSASSTAIFLEFVFLVVEVWRNCKNDGAAMPADLGWIVCARAHATPEFHPTSTRQPRRRGPASKIRDRFSKSIFGRGTRRFLCKACARQRKEHACIQADMSSPCQQTRQNTITGWRLRGLRKLPIQGFLRVEDAGGVFLSVAL